MLLLVLLLVVVALFVMKAFGVAAPVDFGYLGWAVLVVALMVHLGIF